MTAAHPRGGGDQRENRKKGGVAVAEKRQGRDAKTLRRPLGQSEEGRRAGGTFSAHQHPGGLGPRRRSRRGRPAEGGGREAGAAPELSVELPCRAPTPHGSLNALCCGGRFPPKAELCELEGDAQVTHFLKSTCGEIPRTADFLSEEIGLSSITRLGNLSSGEVLGARLPTCAHLGWL